jgi:hypothetical protein
VTTTEAPQSGSSALGVAEVGSPASVSVLGLLVPGVTSTSPDSVFSDGFETP